MHIQYSVEDFYDCKLRNTKAHTRKLIFILPFRFMGCMLELSFISRSTIIIPSFQEIHCNTTVVTNFQPKIKTMTYIQTIVQSSFMELGGIINVTARI